MNKFVLPEKCMIFCLIHAWKENRNSTEIWSVAHVFTLIFHKECKIDIKNHLQAF